MASVKQSSKKFPIVVSLLLFGLGVLAYLPALNNQYTFDDKPHLLDNTHVQSTDNLSDFFLYPTWPGNLYRPLFSISLAVTHGLVGLEPFLYHLTNVIFHCLATIVLYFLLRQLFKESLPSYAALLFLLHPIHTETVANISYRTELMMFLFGCYAALALCQQGFKKNTGIKNTILLSTAAISLFFSLLSKESGFSFFLLIPLCFFHRFGLVPGLKRMLPASCVMLVVSLTYLFLRHNALGDFLVPARHSAFDNPLLLVGTLQRAVNGFLLLGKYLSLSIFPWKLSADYSYAKFTAVENVFSYPSLSNLIVIICCLLGTVFLLLKKNPLAFWGLWFLFSFAITSNIFVPIGTVFADRLCYLGSAGICGLLASGLLAVKSSKPRFILILLISSFYVSRLIYHLPFWHDNYTLFRREVMISPMSSKVHSNYAYELLSRGQLDEARYHYAVALKIFPRNTRAMNGIAFVYLEKKLSSGAIHWLQKSLAINPEYIPALNLLGKVYLYQQELDDAQSLFSKVLSLDSRNTDAAEGLQEIADRKLTP